MLGIRDERKLFLSSYRFGNSPGSLRDLVAPGARAAVIMNAADVYGEGDRPRQLDLNTTSLAELGIDAEELDLRDYFDGPSDLHRELERFGLVWAVGGNSFVLRRAMRRSGFDEVAPDLIRAGTLVYGGFSAGAIVATPTLRGIELVDDPYAIPDGYDPDVIWEGLGLYDRSIAPHFQSDHPESALIDDVVCRFDELRLPFQTIHDGEAIVVRGGESQIVS